MPFVDYGFERKNFHGIILQFAAISDLDEDEFDYIGQDVASDGKVYEIIKDKSGKYYYTVL